MVSVQTFVEKVWEYPTDSIVELPDELQKQLIAEGNSELEAIALTERMMPRVRILILEKIQKCEIKRITPNFRFSESSSNRLVGILISEQEEQLKQKLRHRKELHNLIKDLKWDKFENLCVYTLVLTGFEKYSVGKRTKDGGLDFFGLYPMRFLPSYGGFLMDLKFRIFGQAKHRTQSSVSGKEVYAFYAQFKEDFLYEKGVAYDYVSSNCPWFFEAKGPIVPMVMTNARFTKGAEEFANRKGIIVREGPQIVEDIIRLAKTETWLAIESGTYVFVPERLERYLDGMGSKTPQ